MNCTFKCVPTLAKHCSNALLFINLLQPFEFNSKLKQKISQNHKNHKNIENNINVLTYITNFHYYKLLIIVISEY